MNDLQQEDNKEQQQVILLFTPRRIYHESGKIYIEKTTENCRLPSPRIEPGFHRPQRCVLTTILRWRTWNSCKIVTWRTGLKFRPLRGLGVGNIIYTISLIQKYMVIEVLLCGLGSLVSEGHLLFPKARAPTTPRFIYTTQDSDGRRVSERTSTDNHIVRTL